MNIESIVTIHIQCENEKSKMSPRDLMNSENNETLEIYAEKIAC